MDFFALCDQNFCQNFREAQQTSIAAAFAGRHNVGHRVDNQIRHVGKAGEGLAVSHAGQRQHRPDARLGACAGARLQEAGGCVRG